MSVRCTTEGFAVGRESFTGAPSFLVAEVEVFAVQTSSDEPQRPEVAKTRTPEAERGSDE